MQLAVTQKKTTESIVTFDMSVLPIYRKNINSLSRKYYKVSDYHTNGMLNWVEEISISADRVELRTTLIDVAFDTKTEDASHEEWHEAVKQLRDYVKTL